MLQPAAEGRELRELQELLAQRSAFLGPEETETEAEERQCTTRHATGCGDGSRPSAPATLLEDYVQDLLRLRLEEPLLRAGHAYHVSLLPCPTQ